MLRCGTPEGDSPPRRTAKGCRCHRPESRVLSDGRSRPDDHFSRSAVARALKQSTRGSTLRAEALTPLSRRAVSRRLFDLAPAGVFRAARVATRAVGSYPTFSPLPTLARRCAPAVCFLWHCPSRCRRQHRAQALPGSSPCGARTFLDRCPGRTRARVAIVRPMAYVKQSNDLRPFRLPTAAARERLSPSAGANRTARRAPPRPR